MHANQMDRQRLTSQILQDVQHAISEELEDAPPTLTEEARKAVEDEMIARTNQLLDALSLQEMQSAGAQIRHLQTVRAEVQHLIRHRRP